jgi:hypothetical protein
MRVRELREWLDCIPGDWKVVVPKDTDNKEFDLILSIFPCAYRENPNSDHGEHAVCLLPHNR